MAGGCEPGRFGCATQSSAPRPKKGKKLVDHLALPLDGLQAALLLLFLVFSPSLMSHVLERLLRSFILHHVCYRREQDYS